MKRFVIGDIHGQYNQLEKVLKLCDFDFDNDLLITLGDIVDRGKDWRSSLSKLLESRFEDLYETGKINSNEFDRKFLESKYLLDRLELSTLYKDIKVINEPHT